MFICFGNWNPKETISNPCPSSFINRDSVARGNDKKAWSITIHTFPSQWGDGSNHWTEDTNGLFLTKCCLIYVFIKWKDHGMFDWTSRYVYTLIMNNLTSKGFYFWYLAFSRSSSLLFNNLSRSSCVEKFELAFRHLLICSIIRKKFWIINNDDDINSINYN